MYRVYFLIVGLIISFFLSFGLYYIFGDIYDTWGIAPYFGGISLLCTIPLLALEIWLGIKAFRKRDKENVEIADYDSNEKTDGTMAKCSIGLDINIAGALCYLLGWISGILFIIIERENKFVRFHAMQSIIVFGILSIPVIIILVPRLFGLYYFSVLFPIFWVFVISLIIFLTVEAFLGKKRKLPWIGHLAERYSEY